VKTTNIGRVRGMDNELLSRRFEVESKLFFLDFKQNPNGRYLKITERSGGRRRSFVIVPEGGRFFREGA
jgi:transcriptional activator protein Pur-alpha